MMGSLDRLKSPLVICVVLALVISSTFVVNSLETYDPELQVEGSEEESLVEVAESLYGVNSTYLVFQFADTTEFENAFPGYSPYRIVETTSHPVEVHGMAVEDDQPITSENAFDITKDFNQLIADAGLIIGTSADALKFANAFADIANLELNPNRTIVNSSDSNWLGMEVNDPDVTKTLSGWRVELSTWSRQNGLLQNWTVKFASNEITQGKWEVAKMTVGPDTPEWEAQNLQENVWITNNYNDGSYDLTAQILKDGNFVDLLVPTDLDSLSWTPIANETTYDGSRWTAYKATGYSAPPGLGEAVVNAGNWTTNWLVDRSGEPCGGEQNPTHNWGYVSRDSDCTMEIRILPEDMILCGACVEQGNDTILYLSPDLDSWMSDSIHWYRDGDPYGLNESVRLAVGHLTHVQVAAIHHDQLPDVHFIKPGEGDFVFDGGPYNGTLDPEHFSLRTIYTDMWEPFKPNISTEAGFQSVVPNPLGFEELIVSFNSTAPTNLHEDLVPRNWEIRVKENQTVDTPNITTTWDNTTSYDGSGLDPTDEGIGPGSFIIIDGFDGCTANYIWKSSNGTFYLGTAGHCLVNEGSFITNKTQSLRVCVRNCTVDVADNVELCAGGEGQLAPGLREVFEDLRGERCAVFLGETVNLNFILYARNEKPGEGLDFAAIRIPASLEDLIRPNIPVWGGPDSSMLSCGTVSPRKPPGVRAPHVPLLSTYYGHGILYGDSWFGRARAGFLPDCDPHGKAPYFDHVAAASDGDSGSAVNWANVDGDGRLESQLPLGVVSTVHPCKEICLGGTIAGPPTDYIQSKVETDIGVHLDLVPEGGLGP